MKNSTEVSENLKLELPYYPIILLLGLYPKEAKLLYLEDIFILCLLQHQSQ